MTLNIKALNIKTRDHKLNIRLITFMLVFIPAILIPVKAEIHLYDDTGQIVSLQKPARNVISLSPGLTELIYAAGGENHLKGVVSYSDFPEQAKKLPRIGSYNALDIEKIITLQPDLVIAWKSGNPRHQIEQLKRLGVTVYISEPGNFADIPATMRRLGKLMGTETAAEQKADDFTRQFNHLKQQYDTVNRQSKKRTFIQIWNNPVMSVNQEHLISRVISLCGGENIFAQTSSLTYAPDIESVLEKNPEIIIATGMAETSAQWLKRWKQWPFLSAVKKNRLYAANPDHLVRHTPRILLGIKEVCQLIHDE